MYSTFFEDNEIVNYTDDSNFFSVKRNHKENIKEIKQSPAILFKWLQKSEMNIKTSHLIWSRKSIINARIDENEAEPENKQKLLGVIIDQILSFEDHINNMCAKASQILTALSRIASYKNIPKRKTIMKSFITSHFQYYSLIWMFHTITLNKEINSRHERALKVTYAYRT